MFREVDLPAGVPGRLLLHSMPGRWEPIESTWEAAGRERVQAIVCLTGLAEIRSLSPAYADALCQDAVPCSVLSCEMPDFGAAGDSEAYAAVVRASTERLRTGETILVHCAAGIGRTGTFAVSVLLALGEPLERAERAVVRAGSRPESSEQWQLVTWFASQVRGGR